MVQIRIDDSDIGAKLDMNRPVNFLVHGWLSGVFGGDKDLIEEKNRNPADGRMASTVTRWANAADCNVCAVDWSRLANYEYSIAALINTDKVADYLTAFVRSLRKLGLKVRDTKIAGHSLGAQIAGKVGRAFGGKLGAIHGNHTKSTGPFVLIESNLIFFSTLAMDAAGPGFTAPFDLGVGSRLSASDARYVECIQTAMDTLGTDLDCGHANFIMNDGEEQPGCSGSVICSHSRAYDYFHESLLEEYLLSGPKCVGHITNYISSIFGIECSNDYGYMGIHFKGQLGRFFVKTNAEAPFGKKIPVEEFRRIVTDVVDVPGQNEVEDVSDD